MTLRCQFFTTL